MIKAAIGRHQPLHRVLAGMPERRMAQIMGQRYRLGQIGVQPQNAGQSTRHLRHFDRMGQARAIVIALVLYKDLRFVF